MKSVVYTAALAAALAATAPAHAAAQDPEPAPAVERAVPRAERLRVRESEPGRNDASGAEVRRREPAAASASASAEEDGGQRRGAVRRPPSGGSGGSRSGGATARGESGGSRSGDGSRVSGGSRSGGGSRVATRDDDNDGRTRDRAVPRIGAPPRDRDRDRVYVFPNYYYYNRYYDPWGYGAFGPGFAYYSPWGWGPGYYYGPGYAYGYGYGQYRAFDYDVGSVKLKVKPRDAEVYVDNYFAGQVDDFDGLFQSLKVESGGHSIEIRKPGYETLRFDVHVQPERSVTFRGEMKPVP
jgi:hypothetical protein